MKRATMAWTGRFALGLGFSCLVFAASEMGWCSEPGSPQVRPERYFQPDLDMAQGERFEMAILSQEVREDWKRIQWRSSVENALRDAETAKKPLLFFFTVSEYGEDHSTFT